MTHMMKQFALVAMLGIVVATTGAVSAQASDFARDFFWQQTLDSD